MRKKREKCRLSISFGVKSSRPSRGKEKKEGTGGFYLPRGKREKLLDMTESIVLSGLDRKRDNLYSPARGGKKGKGPRPKASTFYRAHGKKKGGICLLALFRGKAVK